MQYGLCAGPDQATDAKAAGFDYLEGGVGILFVPREDDHAFENAKAAADAAPLPFPAANVFVPGDLPIVGPDADLDALDRYVATVMRRAGALGTVTIVFGSGGARRVPDAYGREDAWRQLREFGAMAAGHALANGVTIVVEPLNKKESNILNTVEECSRLVREVDHPNFRVLVDSYHWWLDDNDGEALLAAADILAHVHVATVPNRLLPGQEDSDFEAFFALLHKIGYDGRVSIECRGDKSTENLEQARRVLTGASA